MLKRTSTGPAAGTRPTAGPRREGPKEHLPATPAGQAPRRRRNGGFPSAPSRSPAAFMCASGRRITGSSRCSRPGKTRRGTGTSSEHVGGAVRLEEGEAMAISRAHCRRRRRLSLRLPPGRRRWLLADPASRFSPMARRVVEVIDPAFDWTDRTGRASPSTARSSTKCTSVPSPCRDLAGGDRRAAGAGRARRDDPRGDADRRFSRRVGWGYDGVDLFAPTAL